MEELVTQLTAPVISITVPLCIITVGHRPFTVQNVAKVVHFSLTTDKTAGELQIVAHVYANNHLHYYYITAQSTVNIITAMQAIVYT